MNLVSCTPGQRESVQHVDGPLLVCAGAGSGKTFTLTQRIAYALLPESGSVPKSIDEVLAITFTEKAAAEIKARVKRTLRAEGMYEEALKVDGAWISTIHGMCARILRTHALELGLDPAFGIVGDVERADLIAASINEALGADNDIIERGSYGALFDEFAARSAGFAASSVTSMLQMLLDKAAGLRDGLDAVQLGPEPPTATALARELLLAYEEVMGALEQGGKSPAAEKARVQASDALEALSAFIAEGPHANLREFAAVVEGCAFLGRNFGTTEVKEQVASYQEVHAHVCRSLALGLAWPRMAELLTLARKVADLYESKKRALCKLDNDDLLLKTLAAFEEHPKVAACYADRFKLVMVDEFQDTSQLQIDLVSHLAGLHLERLCTVGDSQQSIYRFRGADVNVYEAHKRTMRSNAVGALYVELSKNFRSHADVLSFVDRVFEQPQVFGENFMSLEPHTGRASTYRGDGPRIDLVLAERPSERNTGVVAKDVKAACARAIAERFAALRECGHAPGDMVVLLGKMSYAETYAQALRDEGFECAVTGGSLFASAPEVRVVARFVEALANPANTAALFEVLTSDMVRLSADDLLELATEQDSETGELRRRDLDKGFARLAERVEDLPPRLAHAVKLFTRAQHDVRTRPLSYVVRDAVVRSGWMVRLEKQGAAGLACAANVLKALRLIEELENERGLGLASVARAFTAELAAGMKEAPGALSGASGNVVKIMTIHASKGLEFPIVAVADFASSTSKSSKLIVETCGTGAYVSLEAGDSLKTFPNVEKRSKVTGFEDKEDPDLVAARQVLEGAPVQNGWGKPVCTQDAYRTILRERAAAEELAEERRKLYVGLTRASEALVVAMDAKAPAAGKPFAYSDLVDDIRSALCGTNDFPGGETFLEYGGTAPAYFERIAVQAVNDPCAELDVQEEGRLCGPDVQEDEPLCCSDEWRELFVVPRMTGWDPLPRHPWREVSGDTFSYSSIAPAYTPALADVGVAGGEVGVTETVSLDLVSSEPPALPTEGGEEQDSTADADKATALGTAFHRVAQFAIEVGLLPDSARMGAIANTFDLSSTQRARLTSACERWFGSATWAEVQTWELRRAEVPFAVSLDGGLLEGEIDFLCTHDAKPSGAALVIDYKTGGTASETPAQLQNKHLLQAQCYAYALLSQGFGEVELRFVRVEHLGPSHDAATTPEDSFGEPQIVSYHFAQTDLGNLRGVIVEARRAVRSKK